jgi:hypothetical protein
MRICASVILQKDPFLELDIGQNHFWKIECVQHMLINCSCGYAVTEIQNDPHDHNENEYLCDPGATTIRAQQ